jgi:Zn-dependent protease
VKLIIHPLFILAVILAVASSAAAFMFAFVFAVIIHETSHIIVAKHYAIFPAKITLLPFGGQCDIDCRFLPKIHKIIILLGGAFGNSVACVVFGTLVWLFPTVFLYLEYIAAANFLTAVINLLPIFPFDGGKIAAEFINKKIMKIISCFAFAILLIISLIYFNIFLIFFSVVMLITINLNSAQTTLSSALRVKTGRFCEVAVNSHQTLFEIYKMVSPIYPTKFILTDCKNKFFYESDLEKLLITNPISTKISVLRDAL